ncbi:MAG: RNase P subunit p30 family protein [Candidatus Nanohaloarchaea archaeon]
MPEFYDLCLREDSTEVCGTAEELGWTAPCDIDTVFLEAGDWGELKQKIKQERGKADVLVFRGGDEELNRKAASDPRVDVLLHPERGRKDSGMNHVVAKEAAENNVAIGFDFSRLLADDKTKTHVLAHWRRNLKLCEKYGVEYIITTGAREKYGLRAPRDLAAVIDSLGYNGMEAVKHNPSRILNRVKERKGDDFVMPGVKKR